MSAAYCPTGLVILPMKRFILLQCCASDILCLALGRELLTLAHAQHVVQLRFHKKNFLAGVKCALKDVLYVGVFDLNIVKSSIVYSII